MIANIKTCEKVNSELTISDWLAVRLTPCVNVVRLWYSSLIVRQLQTVHLSGLPTPWFLVLARTADESLEVH